MANHLFLISFLYFFSGIGYLIIAIRGIVSRNELRIFDLVRLMYSLVYGFIPFILYIQESYGQRNLYFYDYSLSGLSRIYLMWFLSVVAYGLMNLAYLSVKQKTVSALVNADDKTSDVITTHVTFTNRNYSSRLIICGIISLVIGWVCLFLWTRAYGSINNFILNGALIRSNRGTIYNPLAFLKHFVLILPLSLYSLVSAYFYERPKILRKILYVILISLSLFGNYLYFLASDSRITIIFIGLALLVITLKHRKKEKIASYLIIAACIILALLLITMLADTFTYYVRHGVWRNSYSGFFINFTKEFNFIVSSDMRVIKAWITGELEIQIVNDFLTAITSWIPERFVPFEIPQTIWKYNTYLYESGHSGTAPTSLVATSIYELGLLGIIVFPFFFGLVTGHIERILRRNNTSVYCDVYYGLFAGLFVQMISHNQISTFVTKLFPAFLFFLISTGVDLIFRRSKKTASAPIMPDLTDEENKDRKADKDEGRRSYNRYFDDPIGYVEDDED